MDFRTLFMKAVKARASKCPRFSCADLPCRHFRGSAYCAVGRPDMTMRPIRGAIRTIEQLRLPTPAMDFAPGKCALTLGTGTTGSGKSTE